MQVTFIKNWTGGVGVLYKVGEIADLSIDLVRRLAYEAAISLTPADLASIGAPSKELVVTPAQALAFPGLVSGGGIVTTSSPYRLRKWQAALARVRAGKGNATIACVGDSTTAGVLSNGVTEWPGNKAISYPSLLAAALTAYSGIKTNLGSLTSDNSTYAHGGTVPSFDPRVVLGANWGGNMGAGSCPGGQMIYSQPGALGSAAAETFSFTPTDSFDTVDLYWLRGTSLGTFTVDCGAAVLATQSTGSSLAIKTTVTKTAGAGVVNLIRTSAATCAVLGINTYLSTAKSINVLNMGWSGGQAQVSGWGQTAGSYQPSTALTLYAPDITIINLGINDAILGLSQASVAAGLTNTVTNALLTGDVLMVIPTPPDSTVCSSANFAAAVAAINQVAASFGLPVLDLSARWGSYAISAGYYYTDKLHPTQIGYQDVALAINTVLLSN